MSNGGYFFVFATCNLLGFSFIEPVVVAQNAPKLITRRTEFSSKASEPDKNLDNIVRKLQSLKQKETDEKEITRVRFRSDPYQKQNTRSADSTVMDTTDLNAYLNLLSSSINHPMEGFLHSVPQVMICMLANGTQCGWQANLITVLWSKLSGPVMSLLSSMESQTCPLNLFQKNSASTGAQSSPELDAQLNAFQEILSAALASPNFKTAWKSFTDVLVPPLISYVSRLAVNVLQSSLELLTIALQFGINTPTLDQTQQCSQGDLKQLLMWGISHNLNWSFEDSILNMLLTPVEVPPCSFTDPECQVAQNIQRSNPSISPSSQLSCNQQDVAKLNDTLCAEILASRSQVPDILYHVCKSLSSLPDAEVTQVWRNSCHLINQVLSPLMEPCSSLPSESSQRVVRSTLSLSQLFCNYENWTSEKAIDPALVTMCSDNEPEAFILGVCDNIPVMQNLITNPSNTWVWEYCANASERYMIWQYCLYETWIPQTLDPSIVALCWSNDQTRMENFLCKNLYSYMIVFSNPENNWLLPNCTEVHEPQPVDINTLVSEFCRYSEWRHIRAIGPDQISLCIQNDEPQFLSQVCANSTFLTALVLNKNNAWVEQYCTLYLKDSPTVPALSVGTFTIQPATPLTRSSVVSNSTLSSTNSYNIFPTKTPTVSQENFNITLFNTTLSPSHFPAISSSFSSITLSPTTPLNVSIVSSITVSPPSASVVPQLVSTTSRSTLSPAPTLTSSDVMVNSPLSTVSMIFTTTFPTTKESINALSITSPSITSITLSPTANPTVSPAITSISDLCKYAAWQALPVSPSVVSLCWKFDMLKFHRNVCCSTQLLERLTLDPQNHWLKSVCFDNDTRVVLLQVCLYSEWSKPTVVDMTDLALCADLDTENFKQKVCINTTVLQNLLANLDNSWLLEQCANLTGSGKESIMGFRPSEQCQYETWFAEFPDAAILALCWDYDQANFITSVCIKPALLSHIIQEPSSLWVTTLCATYSNYTTGSQFNTSNVCSTNTSTSKPQSCLVKEMIEGLNWSCSVDLSVVCQPASSQFQGLQAILLCGMEIFLPQLDELMITQATSLWAVLLLVLEEKGMKTRTVTDHIRQSVLDSISVFLEKETHFDNKRVLLQCFPSVLTSLMQTGRDVTLMTSFLIKEYLHIPLANLKAVLSSVDMSTLRQILQFFNRNQANLQLTDEYLRTLVTTLFQIHLRQDSTLIFDLSPLLRFASLQDIRSLPSLQNNVIVLNTVNSNINSLSPEQRQAFGSWFSQSLNVTSVTAGGLSFIRDSGNLITYLPFRRFQLLSPAQLLDGLNVLLRNDLGAMKQEFVALSITGTFRNLTAEQFTRLGSLTCQANLRDLLAYMGSGVFAVIQENIRGCVTDGISIPSNMISSMFFNASELQSPATLSSQRISHLAPFLPLLGTEFLQQLSLSQLLPALSDLSSAPFTPLQAAVIIDKVTSGLNLSDKGTFSKLGSLLSGVTVEALSSLPSDALLSTLSINSTYTAPQVNAITTKLWGSPAVITRLGDVEPLLLNTPLLCVIPQAQLLTNSNSSYTFTWNMQQAKNLFNEAMSTVQSPTLQQFMSLGTVAQGVSCKVLNKLFKNSASASSISDILKVLQEQPVPLHPSLKKCVVEELYKSSFFSELLGKMGAQIALSFPISTFKKFSMTMMDTLRRMIIVEPQYFLLMPKIKQTMLVDKMVDRLGMHTGTYTEEEFRSLGIMATFVADEVFVKLERSFFVDGIEFLRGFCYYSGKIDIVASMLQEPSTFGPVQKWTEATLSQVERFLFFLSKEIVQQIPQDLMSQERIERLFESQHHWEKGDVGLRCEHKSNTIFLRKQFVLQYFWGVQRPRRTSSPIPTCENLHLTQPASWPVASLTNMPSPAFYNCLELIGQDLFFSPYQLSLLLRKTKEVFGLVTSFTPSVTAQLGHIATQLSMDEIASLKLSEIRFIAPLGAVNSWTRKQLGVLFSTILNSTKQTASQLDSSFFVAVGHIICGIEAPVISSLNPVELSKAVLWLGRLNLSCSEEQFGAVISLLSQNMAFGPISSWGSEVFIEIGAFAAGIPDVAMSALVKEQIEGITPLAIALMSAKKFAVVFNQAQISLFTYEQAAAVTEAQRSELSPVQDTALSMVLNPLEDRPVDFRGWSSGVVTSICPVCHLCSLLVLLLMHLFS